MRYPPTYKDTVHSPTDCEVSTVLTDKDSLTDILWGKVTYDRMWAIHRRKNTITNRLRGAGKLVFYLLRDCDVHNDRLWGTFTATYRYVLTDRLCCTFRQIVLYLLIDCVVLTDRWCCTTADYIVLTDRLCCTVLTDRLCCTYRHIELYLPTYCIVLTDILCCTYRQIVTRWQICSYRPLQIHGINYDDL